MTPSKLLTIIRNYCSDLPNDELIKMINKINTFLVSKKHKMTMKQLNSNRIDDLLSSEDFDILNR